MKTAIVTTTINIPEFLDGYCQDFLKHRRSDVCFVVIGDKRTPPEAQTYCEKLERLYGFRMEYFTVERQVEYLQPFPELRDYLPYNSVQRRNIGMLYAYQLGCEVVVTVDDDNYLFEPDLLRAHLRVGEKIELKSYSSSTGWFNPCQFLTVEPEFSPYHRGFPMSKRFVNTEQTEGRRAGRIVVNVGMWLGDPDVDTWLRMTLPVEAKRWTAGEDFVLGQGTWAPFNSQQTAIARDVLPAYFLNPNAGRYDDIWGSYILHRIANHLGDLVSYGSPIVSHLQKRSLASLWRDIEDERMGTLLTDEFVKLLRASKLRSQTYEECCTEIADSLSAELDRSKLAPSQQAYLREYVHGMRVWLGAFAQARAHSLPSVQLVR